ncbi:hypothetical protein WJX77_005715 [Trebouxia sp. C0004]
MMYSPIVKEEPVAQETSTVKPGPIQLSQEERQVLQLSGCSEDKCEKARQEFVLETVAQGLPSPDDWRCTLHLRGSGSERGKVYTTYHPPNGKCLRSKQAAWVLLGLDTKSGAAQLTSNVTKAVTKAVHKRKRAKVTSSSPHPFRLLANLKQDDLEQFLLAIPIYCGSPEHKKHGLWRPIQKRVECMDQDCKDKPADERVMKCSGHASFEAHCGKNPKQNRWRSNFKVDVEGFRGHSVENFMAAHGISLSRRLPTAASAAPQSSSPLSSLPAASLQNQHQHQQDTHSPSESSTDSEPDSTAHPVRRFALHCYDSTEELCEASDVQEQSDSNVEHASSSSGRALDHRRLDCRQERSVAVEQDDLEFNSQDGAASDAEKQARVQAMCSLDAEFAQQRQAPVRAVAKGSATQESKQARLKQDHKNLVRKLRRQIASQDRQLAQAAAQIAKLRQNAAADRAETAMLRAQADSAHIPAPNTTVAGGERAGSPPLPAHRNANACQAGKACGAEQQDQLSVLRQKVRDLEAQSAQYKVQQELARGLYSDLQDEVKSLKSKNYDLTVLGHE